MMNRDMLRVPKLVYDDILPAAFLAECQKLLPESAPKFGLNDIVMVKANFGRQVPAVVAGVECRQPAAGWTYHLIRPRDYDGGLERVCAREVDLEPA